MDLNVVKKAFEKNHYSVSIFSNPLEAAKYLDKKIDNHIVGFGDSVTMHEK